MDNNFSNQFNQQNNENQQQSSQSSNTYYDSTSNYQDYTSVESQYEIPQDYNQPSGGANGMQIAGMVLGILGILVCCCYGIPSLILGGIGLILAIVGNNKNRGNGVGIAGLVLCIIALVLGVLSTALYVYSFYITFTQPDFNNQFQEILSSIQAAQEANQ